MKHYQTICLFLASVSVASTAQANGTRPTILRVDINASTIGDGGTWNTPIPELRDAIGIANTQASATTPYEIWVAEGTYYPTDLQDRSISFELKNHVQIYGGFSGTEKERSERDPDSYTTVLSGALEYDPNQTCALPLSGDVNSDDAVNLADAVELLNSLYTVGHTSIGECERSTGDINGDGNTNIADPIALLYHLFNEGPAPTELTVTNAPACDCRNSWHVVTARDVDESSIIDGFTISNGLADGPEPYNNGGGMWVQDSTLDVARMFFANNSADGSGGGIYAENATVNVVYSTFSENSADLNGGGIYSDGGPVHGQYVGFFDNDAALDAGAIFNNGGAIELDFVTAAFNTSTVQESQFVTTGEMTTFLSVEDGVIMENDDATQVVCPEESDENIDAAENCAQLGEFVDLDPVTGQMSPDPDLIPFKNAMNDLADTTRLTETVESIFDPGLTGLVSDVVDWSSLILDAIQTGVRVCKGAAETASKYDGIAGWVGLGLSVADVSLSQLDDTELTIEELEAQVAEQREMLKEFKEYIDEKANENGELIATKNREFEKTLTNITDCIADANCTAFDDCPQACGFLRLYMDLLDRRSDELTRLEDDLERKREAIKTERRAIQSDINAAHAEGDQNLRARHLDRLEKNTAALGSIINLQDETSNTKTKVSEERLEAGAAYGQLGCADSLNYGELDTFFSGY